MALQTQNLVMTGLGVENDKPPNRVQPPLANGIHLRWAFQRDIGFPWYGYYLFRRRHRPGTFSRLSTVIGGLPAGLWPGSAMNNPFGQISSDRRLRLTKDFPLSGVIEFDLAGRHHLRFKPGELVRRIQVQIGFRDDAEIQVTAWLGNVPVASTEVRGRQNDVRTDELEFDAISAVTVAAGPAALIDLCFVPVSQDATLGWGLIPDLHYPLRLPVTHPDYPASGGLAVDQAADETMALKRVSYGKRSAWAGAPFHELHSTLLKLAAGGPTAKKMAQRSFSLKGVLVPPDPGLEVPTMPEQYPLDLVLLGSLHPAIAQMVGLYWVDRKVESDLAYDYLILADHKGRFHRNPNTALALLQETGFLDVDGYIVFNRIKAPANPLLPPQDVRAYALPGTVIRVQGGGLKDATNNAGLRWDRGLSKVGRTQVLLPGSPVMHHLWRADLGANEPTATPSSSAYKLLTEREPILVTEPKLLQGKTPQRPPNWPPFPLHAIDTCLEEGWYSYQVNGVDIFGRHSPNSSPAAWWQWTPKPDPPPWYYKAPNTPADALVNPFAVRLLDKTPPPPPTAIEAYALDPADPTLMKDSVYNAWWTALKDAPWYQALSEVEKKELIGLRVRWQWPEAYMRQAPDTREFRIYYHPGQMNALIGRTIQVTPAGVAETDVDTDIPNTHPADAFVGCWLRIGTKAFKILASQAGTPLRIRVNNVGPSDNVRPRGNAPGTVALPSKLATDFALATNWQDRFYVVEYNQYVTLASDQDGRPIRQYELFLPDPRSPLHNGLPLMTSLPEPIVYANIGVSSADDKPHATDPPPNADNAPHWASGQWGGRFGNEGSVSPPVKVFRVRRDAPTRPEPPPDANKVFATPADYHNRSYYTYRWKPQDHLKTHIFGALDDSVFKTDWAQRPRKVPLTDQQLELFPDEDRWDSLKRQQVAEDLNHLDTFNHDEAGAAQAMTYYRGLLNDSLRILAGLPGNERAFTQLTIQPLDPADPANANRVGPDNSLDFLVDKTLRAYVVTLDGSSTNRYFYRSAYVDGANNRSPLSLASPPIWLPNVVPPRAPVFTRVLGGNRQITLSWASNREPDVVEYRVYRAENEAAARDLRLMTLMHTEELSPNVLPADRPPEVSWIDQSVPGLMNFYYILVAVDIAGNISAPSQAVIARAFDQSPPKQPVWRSANWIKFDESGGIQPWGKAVATYRAAVMLEWEIEQLGVKCLVQRKLKEGELWSSISAWLPATKVDPSKQKWLWVFHDFALSELVDYTYRLKAVNASGKIIFSTQAEAAGR